MKYSLYSINNFIKLAGPKDKINKYKVTKHDLKSFIMKYKNMIPWNGYTTEGENGEEIVHEIKNESDIEFYLKNVRFPLILEKIDIKKPKSHYLKDYNVEKEYILARRNNYFDPQLEEAYLILKDKKDPEGAKNKMLSHINDQKKRVFSEWTEYIRTTHLEHSPAFSCMMLTQIFDTSDEKIETPPSPVNAAVVAGVLEKLNQGQDINLVKTYEKDLSDHNLKYSAKIPSQGKGDWVHVPKKSKTTEEEYQLNLEKMRGFSRPNRWCTGSGMETTYLPLGDFYFYVINGEAKVAIRFLGEKIVEIQGKGNRRPFTYWKEITDFIEQMKFDKDSLHYKELEKIKLLNEDLNKDPNFREDFKRKLRQDPTLLDRVELENRTADIMQACRDGWKDKISKMSEYEVLTESIYMPNLVIEDPELIQAIHIRVSKIYDQTPERIKEVLTKMPQHWQVFPQGRDILKNAILKKYENGLYWKANAYGVARKSLTDKSEIELAKISLREIQEIIGQYVPEMNNDNSIDNANKIGVAGAITKRFFSQGMPRKEVIDFFSNQENLEKITDEMVNKIKNSHKENYSRQTKDTVFLNKFMDKEINAIAPAWVRKTTGFQSLSEKIKENVLLQFISQYKNFDEENKEKMYPYYKDYVLKKGPIEQKYIEGDESFDSRIKEDPDFRKAVEDYSSNVQDVVNAIKVQPQKYLELPLEVQDYTEVQEAYLKSRVFTKDPLRRKSLPKEYRRLPEFIKLRPDVIEVYRQEVITLLRVAGPNTPFYLKCEDIDPVVDNDPNIVELCLKRARAEEEKRKQVEEIKKRDQEKKSEYVSGTSWYKKARRLA